MESNGLTIGFEYDGEGERDKQVRGLSFWRGKLGNPTTGPLHVPFSLCAMLFPCMPAGLTLSPHSGPCSNAALSERLLQPLDIK